MLCLCAHKVRLGVGRIPTPFRMVRDMETIREIEIWKKKLLDLGKRNNLLNFRDTKSSTLEILLPSFFDAFVRLSTHSSVQVYDAALEDDSEEEEIISLLSEEETGKPDKESFLEKYGHRVPPTQLLLYNPHQPEKRILKGLMRRSLEAISERGVNILYIAFGFVKWRESEESDIFYKAPIIMMPIAIKNNAVNEPFTIHRFDEDCTLNATLQYLLENQYGIELPPFEEQPIEEYLRLVEDKIRKLGWEVLYEAKISTFSFNKLNMYLDMERNAESITANANVAAITEAETNPEIFLSGEELEEMAQSRDLFVNQHNVVDADFSQTEAIEYAMMGKSFVLQGPPGTGKSQTITNMVAELIYAGKKVLFVSEKMAALEVVFNNLKKAGLSDFCLELHSYKANKKDFIEQLYGTLMQPRTVVDGQAEDNEEIIDTTTRHLNAYEQGLYAVREPIGMSLHQLIGIANHLTGAKEIPYVIEDIREKTKTDLENSAKLLALYANYERAIGYNYKNHPLYGLSLNDSSYVFKLRFQETLNKAKTTVDALIRTIKQIEVNYGVTLTDAKQVREYADFLKFLRANHLDQKGFLAKGAIASLLEAAHRSSDLAKSIVKDHQVITRDYDDSILKEDIKALYNDYLAFGSSFMSRLFNSRYRNVKAQLKTFLKNGKSKSYYSSLDSLRTILRYQENVAEFAQISEPLKCANLPLFKGLETDWAALCVPLVQLQQTLNENPSFAATTSFAFDETQIAEFTKVTEDYVLAQTELQPYLDETVEGVANDYSKQSAQYERFIKNLANLDQWVEFCHLLAELRRTGVIAFLDIYLAGNNPLKLVVGSYSLCFYRQWIDAILADNPDLREYNRFVHESDIREFTLSDQKKLLLSRAQINAKLSQARPDPMLQMAGSPASIVMREHEKKKRIRPIRTLMREIPDFIQSIKPCFLMSPLSVSTYLPDDMKFDVTIFDEASQVFPEDAIVAIYRSKQLIVVGDSKQMPPTKFFMATDEGDDEYDEETSDIDAYESILDLCSTTFPTKSLLCHYRSRDEKLIAFSNKNFYNHNLITYPSIHEKEKDLGVDFEYLPRGVMDSRTKVNIPEAERVVDLVFDHFRKHPRRSLGVVAFNVRQQEAILKLLDKRRAQDPSLEEFFKPDAEEPFFVKNLETVQGDERDTIIFSVTYAKNDKGQFAMRFGPLNLAGGERRLNVAVTRAKLNVKVVSSIRATDIDITRVSNRGPKLLREYLDFAEHGNLALVKAIDVSDTESFDSPFEQDVYDFLTQNGFEVTPQVGCSRYRIDLGLKRPGTSDYVLAIECDGATYHSSRSARDRDRLRQAILERMQWKFYRIWSTDWYRNNASEKRALLEACKLALAEPHLETSETNAIRQTVDIDSMVSTLPAAGSVHLYDEYVPLEEIPSGTTSEIAEQYVNFEGPLSIDYLLKHICWIYGRERVNQTVRAAFRRDFRSSRIELEGDFLYAPGQKELAMREGLGRHWVDINLISDYELRNGMYAAIEHNVSCKRPDLYAFIRNQLGFERAGDKIITKLDNAFRLLEPHICIDDDGNITINHQNPLKISHRQ